MPQMNAIPQTSSSEVLNRLRRAMPQLNHLLMPTQSLRSLGLDSIDLVELLCVIENEFQVRLIETDLTSSQTVGALVALIANRSNERRAEA